MECQVCTSPFNQSTRAPIPCVSCDLQCCKECIRTFLIKTCTGLPKCMKCNAQYSMHFMVRHLNRTWVLHQYKEIMTHALTHVEMSKLPDTQPYVEAEQERLRLLYQNREYGKEIDELKKKMLKLSNAIHANQFRMRGEPVPPRLMNEFVDGTTVVTLDTRKKFTMSCPMNECRGFLSTQYKCGTCQTQICSECLTKKEAPHECIESDKLTAEMIKSTTKPCPKCGIRIYKIDGCDQMYCTSLQTGSVCGTAFSWKTGKIETGNIHNPHYYEMSRNGMNLRNVGDIQCGGIPDIGPLTRLLRLTQQTDLGSYLARIHRRLSEHIQYTAHETRQQLQSHDQHTRRVRVNYMLGHLTKDQFSSIIYKQEKEHQKLVDTYHIYDLISISGIETFHCIMQDYSNINLLTMIEAPLTQLNAVRDYCNEQLKQVSITYNCSVSIFDDMFTLQSVKYNINGQKKK